MKSIKKINLFHEKKNVRRGQAMMEFALVIPIFLLMAIGIFEFGRMFIAIITVNTASREAARYGAGIGNSDAGIPYYQDCTGMQNATNAFNLFATVNSVDIRYDNGPDDPRTWESLPACGSLTSVNLADRVAVRIQGEYHPVIFFTGFTIPLESTTFRTLVTKLDIRSTQYVIELPTIAPTAVPTEGPTPIPTVGPPPVNTPVPTIDPNYCNNISVSNITESGGVYSFEIFNTNIVYQAVFDEIWFYLTGTSDKKYFDHISVIDTGASPEIGMVDKYFTVNADPSRFVFLPRTSGSDGDPLMYDGQMIGVKPEGSTRIEFGFTNPSVNASSIDIYFYDSACAKTVTP